MMYVKKCVCIDEVIYKLKGFLFLFRKYARAGEIGF